MSETTFVYLITGFLGSGKTTFLNRIIDRFPKNKKLMILMNEFGEIGVDGTLIENDDLEMMEISKGSIFCVCVKTDFIKGLYQIAQTVAPDVLIIESTGVANPSDLKRDLKLSLFKNRFQFKDQFCIIDARNFLDAFETYTAIEKQIASSTCFLINKVDLATPEIIENIRGVVRNFHPAPEFYETTYADIPLGKFFSDQSAADESGKTALPAESDDPSLTTEQLDRYLEEAMDIITAEMTPPDCLMSAVYRWTGDDIKQVEALAARLPSSILRSKGFLTYRGENYLFSYVMGDWSIEKCEVPSDRIQHKNILVFIGPPESMASLERIEEGGNWIKISTFKPLV
jgi:G3E family GTPase